MSVILATWEAKIRKIAVIGQPRQKFCETQPIAGHRVYTCHPSYERIMVQPSLGKK
jgi:hypothetical protein